MSDRGTASVAVNASVVSARSTVLGHGPWTPTTRPSPSPFPPPLPSFLSASFFQLPIRELDIDIVLECSGKFLSRAALQPALDAGARAVVVSAPIDERDGPPVLNVVYGVNHGAYDGSDPIVTAASCTTNCLAPIVQGGERGGG